mmetsp:Transcript_38137/g.98475  ORF Transcript_38137/g.98475 Transcript_38137/m.98475 type:complete len:201 (+) Transcript_38137:1721-2323(+)
MHIRKIGGGHVPQRYFSIEFEGLLVGEDPANRPQKGIIGVLKTVCNIKREDHHSLRLPIFIPSRPVHERHCGHSSSQKLHNREAVAVLEVEVGAIIDKVVKDEVVVAGGTHRQMTGLSAGTARHPHGFDTTTRYLCLIFECEVLQCVLVQAPTLICRHQAIAVYGEVHYLVFAFEYAHHLSSTTSLQPLPSPTSLLACIG